MILIIFTILLLLVLTFTGYAMVGAKAFIFPIAVVIGYWGVIKPIIRFRGEDWRG